MLDVLNVGLMDLLGLDCGFLSFTIMGWSVLDGGSLNFLISRSGISRFMITGFAF